MSKGVKSCIIVLVIILTLSIVSILIRTQKNKSCFVEIVQDNKILYEIDISDIEFQKIKIETKDGSWNDVLIENGKIFVKDADCPDKNCCRMGYLDNLHNPIVCLPHKLVIRYKDENEN